MTDLSRILGKTVVSIHGMKEESEEIIFTFSGGEFAKFYHDRDCCEIVEVEDVCGDPKDLIGYPLVVAREATLERYNECRDHETATFYEFATNKGSVTIRWLGRSNGYYSERVDIEYGTVIEGEYKDE